MDVVHKLDPVSWDAFVECATRRRQNPQHSLSGSSRSLKTGEMEFFGTYSMDEALSMARDGWAEGATQISRELDSLVPQQECLPEWSLQAAGVMPCIPAYLSGDAECMWQREEEVRIERRLTLLTQLGYPALISAAAIMRYGTAVTAVIRSLEASGVSPALYAMSVTSNYGDGLYVHGVMVREHGEPLDMAKIAFSMHPSFLRRLDFAYRETTPGLEPIGKGGYGTSTECEWECALATSPECGLKVALPPLFELENKGLLRDTARLIEYLREHVAKAINNQAQEPQP